MAANPIPLLILGGNGRIGQVLREQVDLLRALGLTPVWQSRRPCSGFLRWDILTEPCPDGAASGVVLCLAGVTRGSPDALAQNETLAMAACAAVRAQGGRHVFLVSSAAVYGPSDARVSEQTPAAPISLYGQAKFAMEQSALGWHRADGPGLTILRIGNIAGLDMLLGGVRPDQTVLLDPVMGQNGGPVRSYIGPQSLEVVVARLVGLAAQGQPLPNVLNIAAAPAVSMGDLLNAAGVRWRFGPPNPDVIAKVDMDVDLLAGLVNLPASSGQPDVMVAEWNGLVL